MTKDEALKLSLEALEDLGMKHYEITGEVLYKDTFTAIKEALAQPEHCSDCGQKLGDANHIHTCSPQRTWVGLTDEEIRKANHHMVDGAYDYSFKQGVKWSEYKHGITGEKK